MAWGGSAIFTQALLNPLMASAWSTTEPTTYGANGLSADTINVALYNNTVTPDKNAAVGSTGYGTGTWTGNEVTGTAWAAGGQTLGTKTFTAGTGVVAFDAADVSVSGATLAGVYGDMVYDNTITAGTVAKQGLCYHDYGGVQSVTGGTFTIVWDASGVFKVTT